MAEEGGGRDGHEAALAAFRLVALSQRTGCSFCCSEAHRRIALCVAVAAVVAVAVVVALVAVVVAAACAFLFMLRHASAIWLQYRSA